MHLLFLLIVWPKFFVRSISYFSQFHKILSRVSLIGKYTYKQPKAIRWKKKYHMYWKNSSTESNFWEWSDCKWTLDIVIEN